ncbi:MAG: putative quinol monooxygenase [Vicinamibacterales bacterium]
MSETATLQVVARVIARPDTVDAVRRILVGMLEPSRGEEGCLIYELLQCLDDPTDFTFVEEWTDESALDRHAASPHIADVQPELQALVAVPTQVRKYTLIEK